MRSRKSSILSLFLMDTDLRPAAWLGLQYLLAMFGPTAWVQLLALVWGILDRPGMAALRIALAEVVSSIDRLHQARDEYFGSRGLKRPYLGTWYWKPTA